MNDREVMRQALEALEDERYVTKYTHIVEAITALRAQMEQPEQEPAHDLYDEGFRRGREMSSSYKEEARAYKEAYFKLIENVASMKAFEPMPPIFLSTPPAAQQRKPLTKEMVHKLWGNTYDDTTDRAAFEVFARAIKAAHGIGEEP